MLISLCHHIELMEVSVLLHDEKDYEEQMMCANWGKKRKLVITSNEHVSTNHPVVTLILRIWAHLILRCHFLGFFFILSQSTHLVQQINSTIDLSRSNPTSSD